MRTGIIGMGIYLPEKIMTSEEVEIKAGYERLGVQRLASIPACSRFSSDQGARKWKN